MASSVDRAPPGAIRWGRLWIGAFVTLTLGLSAHVVMITWLHVPYPADPPKLSVLKFLNEVAITLGALIIYRLSGMQSVRLHPAAKAGLFFLLITMMAERLLRGPLMNGFVTTAYLYSFIANVPVLVPWLTIAALIVVAAPLASSWRRVGFAAVVIAAIGFLAVGPLVEHLYAPVLAAAAPLQHDAVYGFPYGWQVTSAAYVTYIEPVSACLLATALIWPRTPGGPLPKIAIVTLLIVMVRGSLLSPFAYAAFHGDRWLAAFTSDAQFSLESLVLGVLTALSWHMAATRKAESGSGQDQTAHA